LPNRNCFAIADIPAYGKLWHPPEPAQSPLPNRIRGRTPGTSDGRFERLSAIHNNRGFFAIQYFNIRRGTAMARIFAKYFFAALLCLLATVRCSGQQHLQAVSIGRFTWNLNDIGLNSPTLAHPTLQANLSRRPAFPGQIANCQLMQVNSHRDGSIRADQRGVADNGQPIHGRFPFSRPGDFLNEVFPQNRCYVTDNEYIWLARPVQTHRFDWHFDVDVPELATTLLQLASDTISPVLTSFAEGVVRTASSAAQNVRIPIDRFPIHSAKSVSWTKSARSRANRSDANPLRISERLKPALLPITSAASFEMAPNNAPLSNRGTPTGMKTPMTRIKLPEQMDEYWTYYADCDRWNVVIAGSVAGTGQDPILNTTATSKYGWNEHIAAVTANLDNWLSRAIRQLESQSRSINRDFQSTWQDIEFHLFQASFVKSRGNFEKVHYATKMRNPD
jgi:hypothetical protein